jgi:hypothetical protein
LLPDERRGALRGGLGFLAALLFVAHLLVAGAGHHAAEAAGASHSHSGIATESAHTSGEPHEEPSCGKTLRLRDDGGDSTATTPPPACVDGPARPAWHVHPAAVPAIPRTPNLVRELQVQRV